MLDNLKKLQAFYPVTSDQPAVGRLLDYVGDYFKQKGLTVTRLEHNGTHSLVASTSTQRHTTLMLQAHIDVVPGKDQPFKLEGDKVYGRGVYDMLFGTAAIMQLVDELDVVRSGYDLSIMLVGDEETGGLDGAEPLLKRDGFSADICILPDAGEGFGTMSVGAKGVYQPTIRITGQAHHGSRPWEGDGAAAKLMRFLTEVETLFDASSRENSTLTIATLQAGEAANQGPATAQVSLDIRYKDKADLARIEKGLAQLLKEFNGEIIELHDGSDFSLDVSLPLVQQFIKIYEKAAGQPIRFVRAHGSSDARFFSELDIPVIMLRPDGGGAHGDAEWLSLASLERFYAVLKQYVSAVGKK